MRFKVGDIEIEANTIEEIKELHKLAGDRRPSVATVPIDPELTALRTEYAKVKGKTMVRLREITLAKAGFAGDPLGYLRDLKAKGWQGGEVESADGGESNGESNGDFAPEDDGKEVY